MDSVSGTIWPSMDQKRSKNGHFSERIVFTLPLGFTDVFGPQALFQTPFNAFLPKVLIMRNQGNTR